MRPVAASAVTPVTPVIAPTVSAAPVKDTVPKKKYVPFAKPKHQTEKNKNVGSPKSMKPVQSKDKAPDTMHADYHKTPAFQKPKAGMDTLAANYEFHIDKKIQELNVQVKEMETHINATHNLQVKVQALHNLDVQIQPVRPLNVKIKPIEAMNIQVEPGKKIKPEKASKPAKALKAEQPIKPQKPSKEDKRKPVPADDVKSKGPVRTQVYQSWYPPKPVDPDDRC
ncbi:hypothetical protein MKQ70_05615 [Chitinophaga sedimenti]|uniref:hypothetical protein n=1 Tax=Chitinophaga sedimenti TaxID=2033606 RepID=UPI002003CECD|nr:hypothetical protein [Chitinophaga sedimenti]MCK7554509.1 hypothetical protein [Chitinophaga sedimenti]